MRRGVVQIVSENRWKPTRTSSNKRNFRGLIVTNPRRKKCERKDVELLGNHFREKPGKAANRKKMKEDEELEKLMKRKGLDRCHEKVKTLYKKRKS